jgi:ribonuclease E
VRLEREVKNPKSVILSVVLPGESHSSETSHEVVDAPETSNPYLDSEQAESEREPITWLGESFDADEPETAQTVLATSSDVASDSETPTNPLENGTSDSNSGIVRRRRRRSSALDSEDSAES